MTDDQFLSFVIHRWSLIDFLQHRGETAVLLDPPCVPPANKSTQLVSKLTNLATLQLYTMPFTMFHHEHTTS